MENNWIFNKETFDKMRENFSKNRSIKSFVSVLLELPFAVPFHEKDSYTFFYGDYLVGICTEQIEEPVYYRGKINNNLIQYKSKVEIIFLLNISITRENSEPLAHDFLDLSIEVINYIIDLLVVYKHSHMISRITRMDLPILIPVRSIRTTNFREEMIDEYAMMNIYDISELVKPQYLIGDKRFEFLTQLANHKLNPYIQSTLFLREAYQQLNRGGFNQSIIFTQTSIEVFFSTLLRQILSNQGEKSLDEINNIFNAGYKNWMNDHLAKYFEKESSLFSFSGKNDLKQENILYRYISDIYDKRNRMVHNGMNFNETDAKEAYNRAEIIYSSVTKVINKTELRKLAYPEKLQDLPLIR